MLIPGVVYKLAYLRGHGLVLVRVIRRDNNVKDEVCVGRPGHHAKVVYAHLVGDFVADKVADGLPVLGNLGVVSLDGIHVDSGDAAKLGFQLTLGAVYRIVQLKNIARAIDLSVQGDDETAWAVVVDNEVVDAAYLRVGHDNCRIPRGCLFSITPGGT